MQIASRLIQYLVVIVICLALVNEVECTAVYVIPSILLGVLIAFEMSQE